MTTRSLLLSFVALASASFPVRAVDLNKVDRTIAREPAYKTKPKYCLLVFGPNADFRVWLVLDGETLYIDTNGNGDLTEMGKRLTSPRRIMYPEPALWYGESHLFPPVDLIGPKGTRYTKFSISDLLVKKEIPRLGSESEYVRRVVQRRASHPNLTVADVDGRVRGRYQQWGFAEWSDRPAAAPILHFDGPLVVRPYQPIVLPRRQKPSMIAFDLVTPGFGADDPFTRSPDMNRIPPSARPIAEFEFPNRKPDRPPVKSRVALSGSFDFRGSVRVPADAAVGKARVSVSVTGWDGVSASPVTFDVSVVDNLPVEAQFLPPDLRVRDNLLRTVRFKGYDLPFDLRSALWDLADAHGIVFDVNERAFDHDKLPDVWHVNIADRMNCFPRMETSLGELLHRLLRRLPAESGATYLIRDGKVEITTQRAARAELHLPADKPFPKLIYEEFYNEPCADALKLISARGGVSIAIDPQVEEKLRDACVTASFHNAPAQTALRVLVDMAGLGSTPIGNVLYVTTREKASRKP